MGYVFDAPFASGHKRFLEEVSLHLVFQVAAKFLRRRNSLWPSFTAWASLAGVALGVSSFLVVITVFSSFETELRRALVAANPHLVVYNFPAGIRDALDFQTRMNARIGKSLVSSGLFEYTEGILSREMLTAAAVVRGVEGMRSANAPELAPLVRPKGAFSLLNEPSALGPFDAPVNVVVASGVALKVNAQVGDEVVFTTAGRDGKQISIRLRVVGTFTLGLAGYDERLMFMNFQDAVALWGKGGYARGVEFRIQNPQNAIAMAQKIQPDTPYLVQPWQKLHQSLFDQIERDGRSVKLVVAIITLVAVFNILTTLTVNVVDRARQIALLRSIGATRALVLKVFMLMGLLLGLGGGVLGVGLGLLILRVFQTFEMGDLKSIYFLEKIPVTYDWMLILQAVGLAIVLSFVSSLYPAWKAVRTSPLHGFRPEYR
jgi:lipoprotein-releasing system permease protein